jgi:hypothetical protein
MHHRHRGRSHYRSGGMFTLFFLLLAVLALVFWPLAVAILISVILIAGTAFMAGFLRTWIYGTKDS